MPTLTPSQSIDRRVEFFCLALTYLSTDESCRWCSWEVLMSDAPARASHDVAEAARFFAVAHAEVSS